MLKINVIFCLACIFFIGCSSLPLNLTPSNRHQSEQKKDIDILTDNNKKTITIIVNGLVLNEGVIYEPGGYELEKRYVNNWIKMTRKAYEESGLFSEVNVEWNQKKSDLKTDLTFTISIAKNYKNDSGIYGYLSCLTLALIPCKNSVEVTIKILKKENSKILKDYVINETYTNWFHLFGCLWLLYYKNETEVSNEIYYDLNRFLIKEMQDDGVLR